MTDAPSRFDLPEHLGLATDLYELRMAQTCLRHGMTEPATFSLYVRASTQRPWLLAAGAAHVLQLLERFRYGPSELEYLASQGFGDDLLSWLEAVEPAGEVWAVPEGTVVLADEPLVEVTAPLPWAMLLETTMLSVVQFSTVIATKAARCSLAARGKALADFGFRRAHGLHAGIEAARAAYVGGVTTTSNVEAGRRYGIPVVGTMAHAFVQAFDEEVAAFRAFAFDHPDNAIMLVDTYDTVGGVRNAITVGRELREEGADLNGIRLDSGDLVTLAKESRALLDEAGFHDAQIFASGGVDEYRITELLDAGAPIDAFGVGTALTVSRDHPALDIVYKLVEYAGDPRAKYSAGKVLLPGAKQVFRHGSPAEDIIAVRGEDLPGDTLLEPIWRDGEPAAVDGLEAARERAAAQLEQLPDGWRRSKFGEEPPRPRLSPGLQELADRIWPEDVERVAP